MKGFSLNLFYACFPVYVPETQGIIMGIMQDGERQLNLTLNRKLSTGHQHTLICESMTPLAV